MTSGATSGRVRADRQRPPARASGRAPDRTVLMAPFLRGNPYQQLLGSAIAARGWRVRMAGSTDGRLALVRAWRRAGRPGVVHLHWTHPYLGGAGAPVDPARAAMLLAQVLVLGRMRVRIVWTLHNLGAHDGPDDRLERLVHRALVGRCDAVIAHCPAAVELAVDRFGLPAGSRRRFLVIPHGPFQRWYGPPTPRREARARLGVPRDATVLLSLGRVRPYKGIPELLAAFGAIPAPNARLIVAGAPEPGVSTDALVAAASGDPRIILHLEHLSDHELADLLGCADAAVLPYREVLTSGSAMLAMGAGLPVIGPRLGCLPAQVPAGTGLLYDPAEDGALEATLRLALASDLAGLGGTAARAADRLDWGAIADATITAYTGARSTRVGIVTGAGDGVRESRP